MALPVAGGKVPVQLKGWLRRPAEEFKDKLAATVTVEVGVQLVEISQDVPAASVVGHVVPVTAKTALPTVPGRLNVTGKAPVLDTRCVVVLDEPICGEA